MAEPLAGVRVIEFGQLLAGPFTGTLLGRLRRRRDQGRGAAATATRCATGAACATTTTRLWWSILARNKR